MEKNSFTLFETLLSVIVLSIIVASFYKLTTSSTNQDIYKQLQEYKSNFTIQYYDFTYQSLPNATVTINDNKKYKKIVYKTKDLLLEKYTLQER